MEIVLNQKVIFFFFFIGNYSVSFFLTSGHFRGPGDKSHDLVMSEAIS